MRPPVSFTRRSVEASANDTFAREEALFHAARGLPAGERSAFLLDASAGNQALLAAVEALLAAAERSCPDVDRPLPDLLGGEAGAAADFRVAARALAPHYTLIDRLGEGGWGTVYRADQLTPVKRRVAVKVLKAGLDTRAVVARFRAEQQALAVMDHPYIAKVFDAGEAANGRPFFAMELVGGTRITEFCDERRLPLRERLRVFARVCDAIRHAHQKGVIHRDLKPSNILVSDGADGPQPKIIDFGIAKAIPHVRDRLSDATLVTEFDAFMGTPVYMSPEQAIHDGRDIDTRADIYSLGVVLYELLTGCTPLDAAELRGQSTEEVRRRVSSGEIRRPSRRLRDAEAAELARIAQAQQAEPRALLAALEGDLDWIVLRCLEKERARRYDSVGALLSDVENTLRHEPIMARPPSRAYVWGKFMRRHRVGFSIAAALAVLLVAGGTVSTGLFLRERTRLAQAEAARSAQAMQFMRTMLNGVGPAVARGRDTQLLRDLLNEASTRLDRDVAHQPEIEADLREVIGDILFSLEEVEQSERMQRRALALREKALGPHHPRVADSLLRVGRLMDYGGVGAPAEALFRRALAIRTTALGVEHPETAEAMGAVGRTLNSQKRSAEAKDVLETAHAIQERTLPREDLARFRTKITLSIALRDLGEREAAVRMLQQFLAEFPADSGEARGPVFKHEGWLALADTYAGAQKLAEAVEYYRLVIAAEQELGSQNPDVRIRLARVFRHLAQYQEALQVLSSAVAQARQRMEREPNTRRFVTTLGDALSFQGEILFQLKRHDEAEPVLREAVALRQTGTRWRPPHPLYQLAPTLAALGKSAAAEEAFIASIQEAEQEAYAGIDGQARGYHRLLVAAGRRAEADAMFRARLDVERRLVAERGEKATAGYSVALLYGALEVGMTAEAGQIARERLAWWDAHEPADGCTHAFRAIVGEALLAQKHYAAAEPLLVGAAPFLHRLGASLPNGAAHSTYKIRAAIGRLYRETNRPTELAAWQKFTAETDHFGNPIAGPKNN
jgi:serine/threonine protein kinase/tetratricopeptide (TPR) repeat protein